MSVSLKLGLLFFQRMASIHDIVCARAGGVLHASHSRRRPVDEQALLLLRGGVPEAAERQRGGAVGLRQAQGVSPNRTERSNFPPLFLTRRPFPLQDDDAEVHDGEEEHLDVQQAPRRRPRPLQPGLPDDIVHVPGTTGCMLAQIDFIRKCSLLRRFYGLTIQNQLVFDSQYDPKRSEERMKKREIKLRAIESNGFDGEVPLKPLSTV